MEVRAVASESVRRPPRRTRSSRRDEARQSSIPLDGRHRTVIERVLPEVDSGRFAIKRTAGEAVEVTAHVHADGHDLLRVLLKYRRHEDGSQPWAEIPMRDTGNDEWRATFLVDHVGTYEYTVEAWVDRFLSWRHEVAVKARAGLDLSAELLEGAALVASAAVRCRSGSSRPAGRPDGTDELASEPPDHAQLAEQARLIGGDADPALRTNAALDDRLADLMMRHADRTFASTYKSILRVVVDRARARFGAWYEMFPRSWGPDPTRSATLREAAHHLHNVAALGFDVVYLPPIHPIGTSFRKGRGNALVAGPGDPGSPWAIGSHEGGHTAVEPGLGTLHDFDTFVASAHRLGLEVALDLAYQCSPDHPYVRTHPEWFRHRADGTIKYAENPPKKYQDIYPFDFESPAWQALWNELLEVVRFWIRHGVRIFRVDNPHTKPYRFWEWLIAQIRLDHPETLFLSEAFTRPKVMYHLAKLGFTQSYTYFTWRNSKREIEDYFTELTQTEVREYVRPNLFANTPDILHAFLQTGGPAAFKTRLVLAATLGATYGIYSGFELCEGRAVPGTEEYLESEKYQYRHWDWNQPGIKDLIASVNRIRRERAALQFDHGLRFLETDNPQIIAYTKTPPDRTSFVLVTVNLDPHRVQHGWVRVPAGELGLPADSPYAARDLLTDAIYTWRGEWNYVRLDPAGLPAHILTMDAP
jgi:starch synthase (maltosyl-transferring)